jgi:hypothetical protein
MKKLLIAASLLCAASLSASASTVTATLTDSDGIAWANATWTAKITLPGQPFSGNPAITIGGNPASPTSAHGNLSATGVMTATLLDTSTIDQPGAVWSFVVCPNTSAGCQGFSTTVVGTAPNMSAKMSSLISAIRFSVGDGAYGYSDVEVNTTPPPNLGARYYNVTTPCYRQFSLAGWTCGGGSSISLTTTGSSGASTLIGGILNIPVYSGGAVTATAMQLALNGQTGCTTSGFVWVPASNTCVAQSGGLPSGTGLVGVTSGTGGLANSTQIQTAIGGGVYAPLVSGVVPPASLGSNPTGGSTAFLNAAGAYAIPSGTGGNASILQGTTVGTTVPTQAGQSLGVTGTAGALTYSPGNPTAGNVQTAALLQPFTAYTTQATTCNAITDTNAKAACLSQDSAMLGTQTALVNAGLISPSNPLSSLFTIAWNMAPVTVGSTINSLVGTHVLTTQTGLLPAPTIGQQFPTELMFGQCANGPAFATTCQNGTANSNAFASLKDTTSTSDATCFGTDCTVLLVARSNLSLYLTTGLKVTAASNHVFKPQEYQINVWPSAAGPNVAVWNNATLAYVVAPCPSYSTNYTAAGNPPSFFPIGSNQSLTYVWLVYNHTTGAVACAINDGPLGTPVTSTLTATSNQAVSVGQGQGGIEHFAYSPTQASQSNRAAYYNAGVGRHAPNYTDSDFAQWQHVQFQNADIQDAASPLFLSNGGTLANVTYRSYSSQSHATVSTNAPRIAFDFNPGNTNLLGPNVSIRVKVDGVLASYDWEYTADKKQILSVSLDGSTHIVDVGVGATQANVVAPFTAAQFYSALGGEFIDGYYTPRGNYTTTVVPYAPITSLTVATNGTGQTNGLYILTSSGCLYPATARVVVQSGAINSVTLTTSGSYCTTPTFAMPAIGGTLGTLTASIGSMSTTVWVVDSILSGFANNNGSTDAATAMERSGQLLPSPTTDSFGDTNTAVVGSSSILMQTDCPTQAACNAWFQANISSLANVRNIVMGRGANDKLKAAALSPPECLAGWSNVLGFFLTSVQNFTPTAKVWMQAILPQSAANEASTDGCASSTNTLTQYRAAEATACSAYAGAGGCAYVDTTVTANGWPDPAAAGNLFTDGLHYLSQGHVFICNGWKNATGSSFPVCMNPE